MAQCTGSTTPPPTAAVIFLAGLAIALAGCGGAQRSDPARPVAFRGPTMGTSFHVIVVGLPATVDREALRRGVEDVLARVNRQMSTYRPDSEVSRFNRHRGDDWFAVSPETAAVVHAALEVSRLTGGAFDVTVGPLVDLWGFGPRARDPIPPSDAQIERCRARVGWQHLEARLEPPALRKRVDGVEVDLSAIAKGFGVDRVGACLDAAGAAAWMVEIGGEVRTRGPKPGGAPWKIGVEAPRVGHRAVEEKLAVNNRALATSGNYRNFFERDGQRFGHTLDPRTGRPVDHRGASVTVLASTCMRADALATALMVLGPEAGHALATRHAIAALFLVHAGSGIERKPTPAFAAAARQL